MKTLVILLTDSIQTFYNKGELKKNYYNPGDLFDDIVMVTFTKNDIEAKEVGFIAGRANLRIIPVGKLRLLSFIPIFFRVFKLIKAIRPNAIRAYDPSLRGFFAVVIGKLLDIPVFISLHANLDEQRKHNRKAVFRLRIILEKFSIALADSIICVTEHVANYAKMNGAKDPLVIYNRVDFSQFDYKRKKPVPKLILTIGRLDPQKYHACILESIRDIDVKLVIIGQGPDYPMVKGLVTKMGLNNKVELIGHVQHSEIHKYYEICEVFAIATHYEGFCIPVLEAMASGTPVVASDVPSIREIGFGAVKLVKNSPEEFSGAFTEIIGNDVIKAEMIDRGIKLAKERFDYHKLEKLEKDAYSKLI